MNGRKETAPGEGGGVEAGPQGGEGRRKHLSKIDSASAMTHKAKADLHARASAIIARAILADRLASPDLHVVMESWRLIVEREAYYHEQKAFKLQYGGHPLDFLEAAEAAFEPRTS